MRSHRVTRKIALVAALSLPLSGSVAVAGLSGRVEAQGCIKGAVVGAVVGKAAHHGVAGALAGCAAGKALSKTLAKHKAAAAANAPTTVAAK